MKLLARLVSAVGVGAIFGHKAQQEAHWSEAEHWIAGAETDDANTDGS